MGVLLSSTPTGAGTNSFRPADDELRVQPGATVSSTGVINSSIFSATSACMLGIRCPYTSRVMDGREWPSILETTRTGMSWFNIKDAAVWRRSWKRITGNPASRELVG